MSEQIVNNPLLLDDFHYRFDLIKPEHFLPAMKKVLTEIQPCLEKLFQSECRPAFESVIQPMIDIDEKIDRVWHPLRHLMRVDGNQEIYEARDAVAAYHLKFNVRLSLDEKYNEKLREYFKTEEYAGLKGEKRRYAEELKISMKLKGANLNDAGYNRLLHLRSRMIRLETLFQKNIQNSPYVLILKDERDLSGIPVSERNQAFLRAERAGLMKIAGSDESKISKSWLFDSSPGAYCSFMQYSDRGYLRERFWRGLISTSVRENADNRPVLQELLELRIQEAFLLGYYSYAHSGLEFRIAESPEEILKFLEELYEKTKGPALKEYRDLLSFIRGVSGRDIRGIMPWDELYWLTRYRIEKLKYSEQEAKQYFALNDCLEGMFRIAGLLFGLEFKRKTDIPVWNEDVSVFEVMDTEKPKKAYLYLDLFARPGIKQKGAWKKVLVRGYSGKIAQTSIQCNFTKPEEGEKCLLSIREIKTLFHEFGHALHDMLSRTELYPMSGTSVERDAVEFPSQFMAMFLDAPETLRIIGKHHKTGKPIPEELIRKIIEAENFYSNMIQIEDIFKSIYDIKLHNTNLRESLPPDAHELYKELHEKYMLTPYVEDTYLESRFLHIFAYDYAAGFYSYLWAKNYAEEVFSHFRNSGNVLNGKLGRKFAECILEKGASREIREGLKEFKAE